MEKLPHAITSIKEDAAKHLHNAANALLRAKTAVYDGGGPTAISTADPVLEEAAIAEIECAIALIARAVR